MSPFSQDRTFRRNAGILTDYTTTTWIFVVMQTPYPVTPVVCLVDPSATRSSSYDFIVNQNQLWHDATRDLSPNDGHLETEENFYFLIHVLWSVWRMQVISVNSSVRLGAVWDDDQVALGSVVDLHDGKSVNTIWGNVIIAPPWRFVHTLPVVMTFINAVTLFMWPSHCIVNP